MKRLLFVFTLSLTLISFRSFAGDVEVSVAIRESFQNSFKNAKEVNWTMVDHYYKASFILNEQYISAFYDADGKMIALTRNISLDQLPISLQLALKKNYGSYWITNLFEMS